MKWTVMVAACAAAVASSGVAHADDATVDDLKCVVVFGAMAGNPQYKDAAYIGPGIFYFLGRVEGREPGLDLKTALKHLRDGVPYGQYADVAKRCGAALKDRNDWLKSVSGGQSATRGVGG
ncbi:MAG: hypothetical protein ACJ798_12960 [Phenylobacterium sp.]